MLVSGNLHYKSCAFYRLNGLLKRMTCTLMEHLPLFVEKKWKYNDFTTRLPPRTECIYNERPFRLYGLIQNIVTVKL